MRTKISLDEYNIFCSNLVEGCILYNLDSSNQWGEYLLVVNISPVQINNTKTYSVLLIGLEKENGKFKSRDLKVNLTPDYAQNTSFLKFVGQCNFQLMPVLDNVNVNKALATIYGNTDLRKFHKTTLTRKPKTRKYDLTGKPVIKKTRNN